MALAPPVAPSEDVPPPDSERRLKPVGPPSAVDDIRESLDVAVRMAERLIGRIEGVYDDSKGFGFERSDCVSLVKLARRVRSEVAGAQITFDGIARRGERDEPEKPIPFVPREASPAPSGEVPGRLAPYTIANRIECAVQHLTLLDWALNSRLDDADEIEVFTHPLNQAKSELGALCEQLLANEAPASKRCDSNGS